MALATYTWVPWHAWKPLHCTQIDGLLRLPEGGALPLDVWSEDDEDITIDMIRGSSTIWRNGGVRFQISGGLFNLIVPIAALTEEIVTEAIRRFCFVAYGAVSESVVVDHTVVVADLAAS